MCASNQIRFLKYRKSTLCVAGPRYESCEALPREDERKCELDIILLKMGEKIYATGPGCHLKGMGFQKFICLFEFTVFSNI